MFSSKPRSVNIEAIAFLTLITVFIAASKTNEPHGDLQRVAEAGSIEEPLLSERGNEGIYTYIHTYIFCSGNFGNNIASLYLTF